MLKRAIACTLVLFFVFLRGGTGIAAADEPLKIPPPPSDFGTKQRLSDEDYLKKKEGGYFTGLPLANYDSNTGFGAGARVYYFINGKRDDSLFAYTPYQHRFFATLFFTTGGLQFHWFDYDAPALFGSPWRLRSQTIYARNTSQNYFGIGERGRPLTFSGAGRSYSSFADYQSDLDRARPDGSTNALYNKYLLERPFSLTTIERSLLGGILRTQFGIGISHNNIHDYTASRADDKGHAAAPTKIREDCDALQHGGRGAPQTPRIVGCDGGWDNTVRVGLAFDTRDFEPDPNKGIYADLAADFGTRALGSDFDYSRLMLAVRGYYSPIAKLADLVLAARGVYLVQSQGAPFFSMDTFPFTEDVRFGLGGLRTLRGYKYDRFVGHVMALTNFEIRWTFAETVLWKQRFAFGVVPFMDIGRVFDSVRRTTLADWNRTQGGGLRIAWNQATVLMVDYGISAEDSGLYINFGHSF